MTLEFMTRLNSGEMLEYKARIGLLHRVQYQRERGFYLLEVIDENNVVKCNNFALTGYELSILMRQYAPIKLWYWKPKQEVKR